MRFESTNAKAIPVKMAPHVSKSSMAWVSNVTVPLDTPALYVKHLSLTVAKACVKTEPRASKDHRVVISVVVCRAIPVSIAVLLSTSKINLLKVICASILTLNENRQ